MLSWVPTPGDLIRWILDHLGSVPMVILAILLCPAAVALLNRLGSPGTYGGVPEPDAPADDSGEDDGAPDLEREHYVQGSWEYRRRKHLDEEERERLARLRRADEERRDEEQRLIDGL